MLVSAQPIRQEVEARTSRPADSHASLEAYRRVLGQDWTRYFEAASSALANVPQDAFAAIRHTAAHGRVNLSQIEPEERFLVSRPAVSAGEAFHGKHGRLTVIRKK